MDLRSSSVIAFLEYPNILTSCNIYTKEGVT
jgi:hypothetical protein